MPCGIVTVHMYSPSDHVVHFSVLYTFTWRFIAGCNTGGGFKIPLFEMINIKSILLQGFDIVINLLKKS
jgi:hypothetical protein